MTDLMWKNATAAFVIVWLVWQGIDSSLCSDCMCELADTCDILLEIQYCDCDSFWTMFYSRLARQPYLFVRCFRIVHQFR